MRKLHVPLNKEERKERYGVVAITFDLNEEGWFVVTEEWEQTDELYSSAVRIAIPPRVWREAISVFFAGAPS